MLFVTQTKTQDRVIVPLQPVTKRILEKYAMETPQVNNVEFNFHINEIAKLAGLDELKKVQMIKKLWKMKPGLVG